jgi:hypothetical protein
MKYITAILLVLSLFSGATNADGILRDSIKGAVVINQPIDVGMVVQGIKVESIYFDKKEALVILWNRTPKSAKTNLGLALFDKEDKLIGIGKFQSTNLIATTTVRSGKQAKFELNYEKFINDIEKVSSFQLVLSVSTLSEKKAPEF